MTGPLQNLLNTVRVVAFQKSVLVIHKILRLFANTLTVEEKHYMLNRDNRTQPIQMQLSEKQTNFVDFFFAFLKSILNFKHLPKKMSLIADKFKEILAAKNMVR